MPIVELPDEPLYNLTKDDVQKMMKGGKDHVRMHSHLQFVPGTVGKCILNKDNTDWMENCENTIYALPHIGYKGLKKLSALGEENRYFPLLRGMTDVPGFGEPVLLCKIGKTQYYLGPLNTDNKANYNKCEYIGDQLVAEGQETIVKNSDDSFVPTKHKRLQKLLKKPLDFPANDGDEFISNEVSPDMILEGRHGNSIRIGSRNINPYIIMSNGRSVDSIQEGSLDNSIFAMFKHGTIRQHFDKDAVRDNTKDDKADKKIKDYLFKFADDELETVYKSISTTFKKNIGRGNLETGEHDINVEDTIYKYGEKENQGQAFLSSDRITFNARRDSIFLSAFKHIHLGSGNSMTFSTSNNILFEAQISSITNTKLFKVNSDVVEIDGREAIVLGAPSLDQTQKAVLGDNLLMGLEMLIADIQTALIQVSSAIEGRSSVGYAMDIMQAEANNIEKTKDFISNTILSSKVHLKP